MTTAPEVRHVVIVRTDRIGDLLVSTPAIRNVRVALPEARITLVTSPSCADVLKGWDAIDDIVVFDWAAPRNGRAHVVEGLRRAAPDVVCAFTPQSRVYALARRLGAPVRVGFGYRSRPLDHAVARLLLTHPVFSRVPETPAGSHRVPHHAEELLAVVQALGIPAPPRRMEVPIAEADRAWVEALLVKRGATSAPILLHLSHKWLDEGWNSDHVVALIEALVLIGDQRQVAITVGPGDARVWNVVRLNVERMATTNRLFVVEHASFGRWAALIASAALVVSPDTGAIHVGSATGRPVFGVYARHRFHVFSRQWGPWMVPCQAVAKTRGTEGVRAIATGVESLLHEVAPRRLGA